MLKDITKIKQSECTGCGTCFNICPVSAISMQPNSEGFLYPQIDENKCVNCGLCEKSCPIVQVKSINNKKPECYAVMATDEIREKSSSGGMFTLLANYILEQGGYVCGAAYNKDWSVSHIIIDNKEDLAKLRGSKYIQSNTDKCYTEIKQLLKDNKLVLFTGCPCQVAGLYSYLDKDYDNLLTMDIFCNGVPSPGLWQKYLKEFDIKKIININFRDKKQIGWSCSKVTITTTKENIVTGTFTKGFHPALINRKSCSDCKFSKYPRYSDISVGDFWGINSIAEDLNDNKGTSIVLLNSTKGEHYFNAIKSYKKKQLVVLPEEYNNGRLIDSGKEHHNRDKFFTNYNDRLSVEKNIAKNLMFDIGIMGFWYGLNYGSILTYYALNKVLQDMGYSTLMIEKPTSPCDWENNQKTHSRIFAKKHYTISKYRHYRNLKQLNNICNTFILGSDQVFAPGCYRWFRNSLFFDFVDKNHKTIAYAASFGHKNFTNSFKEKLRLKIFIKAFDAISVREDSGVEILKDKFNTNGVHTLDPLFLCNMKHYEDLIDEIEPVEENHHILTYILDPNQEKKNFILNSANKLNKKFVNILDGNHYNHEKNKAKLDLENTKHVVNIQEFLAYFKNSDFVITDSFHGTCIAILFKKPFIAIGNKKRGITRFESLLKKFNLMDRLIYNIDEINSELFTPINYDEVYKILEKEKELSLKWLIDALKKPVKKNKANIIDNILKFIFEMPYQIEDYKIFIRYYRYKLMSKIIIGKKKAHYKKKRDEWHKKVKLMR